MPITISCPSCERKLRVPDDLLGKKVKCPGCKDTFTAEDPDAVVDVDVIEEEKNASQPAEGKAAARDEDEGIREERRAARRRRAEEEYEEVDHADDDEEERPRRRRRRRDYEPHRGGLILTMGILSLVICGLLGPVAWIMGNNDLREMDARRMDPAGRGNTQAGKICGMISTILIIVGCVGYGLVFIIMAATARK